MWYLQAHFEWLKLSYSSIQFLLVSVLGGSRHGVSGWTSVNVKLLLPPRQSRGNSRLDEGQTMIVLVATPQYIAHYGTPESPEDLSRFRSVVLVEQGSVQPWSFV